MAIETTFMRYGKGKSGIIGLTLKPETIETWAHSLTACNKVISSLDSMRSQTSHEQSSEKHKEESKSQIVLDSKDRTSLHEKLETCINPFKESLHSQDLVNIISGKVVSGTLVNVDNADHLGLNQMKEFEKTWPNGFHQPLQKCVKTMAVSKKHIKLRHQNLFDTELIYARAMRLQNSLREYDTGNLMSYELSPYPPAMFERNGQRKQATSKFILKECTESRSPYKTCRIPGCVVMWTAPWPPKGTIQDYLDSFRRHIHFYLQTSQVYLIFDR